MEKRRLLAGLTGQAFQRMPYYLQYLRELREQGVKTVSAPQMAAQFGFSQVQVRKDLAAVYLGQGKPKIGFELDALLEGIESALGYRQSETVALVGVGSLGKAMLQYKGFEPYGLKIELVFDRKGAFSGGEMEGRLVYSPNRISELCRKMRIGVGIITVPADQAQLVCDQLVAGGVGAIWNFAPVHLSVPEGVLVRNENLAASLALLTRQYRDRAESE